MEKRILALVIFISLAVFNQKTFAQLEVKTILSSMYDDNVNNNLLKLNSNISSLNLMAGYKWENDNAGLRLFYDGSFSYYASMLERSYHFHSANMEYTRLFGEENQNIFNAGGSYGTGINREEYSIFNHDLYSAYVNYKYFPANWFINKFGYSFRSMNFSTLSDLSYTEHVLFVHTAFAITEATTLIFQTDLGSKFYSSSIVSNNDGFMPKGKNSLMPAVSQLTETIKVGQKINDVTGLSLTSKYQWNIRKEARYLSSDYGLISDDELFDDHYGNEGLHTNIMLTRIISESVTAKLTMGIQNKLYSTLPAYDLIGNMIADQRVDKKSYLNFQIQKNFETLGFSVKAAADIIYNKSNDSFYNYHNNAFMLEVEVPLLF